MPIYTNAVHVGRVRRGTATVMAMLFLAIFVALAVALASTLTASVSLTRISN